MKKEEYMARLKQELINEDAELRDEILNDYEEHFDAGIKNGKTEEEICEELGSISEFMDELKQMKQSSSYESSKSSADENAKEQEKANEENSDKEQSSKQNREHRYGGYAYYSSQNGSKTYSFDFNDESLKHLGDKLNQLGDKISRRVNDIVSDVTGAFQNDFYNQKAADNEQAQYRTYTAYDSKEEIVPSGSSTEESEKECFHRIRIIGKFADVIVEKAESENLHVSARNYGSPKQQMLYRLVQRREGDTLVFELESDNSNQTFFFWKATNPCMKIYVSLPSFIHELLIENGSGDVELHNIRTPQVNVNAGSGDVTSSGCEGAELKVHTGSGDIRIQRDSHLKFSFECGSGDISVDGITGETTTMHAGSGNISCYSFRGRNIAATTGSGDISFSDGDAEELAINTSSGDIRADQMTVGNFIVRSASGDMNAEKIVAAETSFTTKSGDCQLRIRAKKCHAESVSGDVTAYLSGLKEGSFKSVSGEVKVVLQDHPGYLANVRTASGESTLRYHGEVTRVKSGSFGFGNEECTLQADSVSGDIDIIS